MRSYVAFNRRLAKQYEVWMVAMHYAQQTQWIYKRTLRRFLEFVGKKSVANVKHTDIRRYIASASEDGATLDSVYRDLGILRQLYDFLNLGGVVHYVAPRFVRLRRPWRGSPRPLALPTTSVVERLVVSALELQTLEAYETVRSAYAALPPKDREALRSTRSRRIVLDAVLQGGPARNRP